MPHNYCYHSKKNKLIYFEFSSHCLVWLASRLEPAREPPPSRAEPDLLARKNSEPSRARLVHLPSRAELSSARLVSSPMYKDATTFVRTCDGNTTDFPINIGIHQGISIEPLFICFSDG